MYTSGHHTKCNAGWSSDGLERYNELYDLVLADRTGTNNAAFDAYITNHYTMMKQVVQTVANHNSGVTAKVVRMRFRGWMPALPGAKPFNVDGERSDGAENKPSSSSKDNAGYAEAWINTPTYYCKQKQNHLYSH